MKKESRNLTPRPPVVVVMGHIDHGKSKLLDYIRKSNVVDQEEGGITQKISAYEAEVEVSGEKRKITFLDTPGHEAFCAIRERGARVADIAILVVSSEDGVKPQTLEAVNCVKKDDMPFIVAASKIDKPSSDINKVKQSLAENGILVEGWGGTVPFVPISSKTGEGIPELLEMVILQSDIENFSGDPEAKGEGFVIESGKSPKEGIFATLVVKNGSLKSGEFAAAAGAYVKTKIMKNYRGEHIEKAAMSQPVQVWGWNKEPLVGGVFETFDYKLAATAYATSSFLRQEGACQDKGESQVSLLLVLKAESVGSLEAVEYEILKLGDEKIRAKIISRGVGNITEKDVKTAFVKKNLIIGFNVIADKNIEALAARDGVEIKKFSIIYELVDFIKEKLEKAAPLETVETVVGKGKVVKIFSSNKDKQVVGGRVEEGEMKSGSGIRILRRDSQIGQGKIKELQSKKVKTSSVGVGEEFGMMVESKTEIAPGDILEILEMRSC